MKKKFEFLTGFFVVFLISLACGVKMQCLAANSYTVTFRAGNVGTFQTDAITTSKDVEISENYIKIKVPDGATIADVIAATDNVASSSADLDYFFRQVTKVETGYLLLDESSWGPAVSGVVERNEDYVLDYGTLVDPVEYEIQYVDSTSGKSVAASLISYGNEGDTIKVSPITVSGYAAQDAGTSLTLSKSSKNQLSLKYTKTASNSGNVTTQVVPGKTNVNSQTRIVYETADNAAVANANANVAAANANANAANDNNAGVTNIQDGNVPLSDGAKEDAGDDKAIADDNVPLSDGKEKDSNYAYGKILIPSVVAICATVVALSIYIRRKRKK